MKEKSRKIDPSATHVGTCGLHLVLFTHRDEPGSHLDSTRLEPPRCSSLLGSARVRSSPLEGDVAHCVLDDIVSTVVSFRMVVVDLGSGGRMLEMWRSLFWGKIVQWERAAMDYCVAPRTRADSSGLGLEAL